MISIPVYYFLDRLVWLQNSFLVMEQNQGTTFMYPWIGSLYVTVNRRFRSHSKPISSSWKQFRKLTQVTYVNVLPANSLRHTKLLAFPVACWNPAQNCILFDWPAFMVTLDFEALRSGRANLKRVNKPPVSVRFEWGVPLMESAHHICHSLP